MKLIIYIYNSQRELLTKEKVVKFIPSGFKLLPVANNNKRKLLSVFARADYILVSWGNIQIDSKLISRSKKIKLIQKLGSGFNGIDLTAAKRKGIKIANTPGVNSHAVAEHTFLLMLVLAKNFPFFVNNLESGKIGNVFKKLLHGGVAELKDKTLGLIGFGRTGQEVARIAEAFRMKVFYHCLHRKNKTLELKLAAQCFAFEQILRRVDFVSLHLPLTSKTKNFFGKKEFKAMKKTAFFINTARGGLVCEKDLLNALNNGEIAGAALDVLQDETQIEKSILYNHPKVIITPHIAGITREVFEKMIKEGIKNIARANRGRQPKNLVIRG